MKGVKSERTMTPVSSAGIMHFFDVGGGGPKVSAEAVMMLIIVFIGFLLFFKFVS